MEPKLVGQSGTDNPASLLVTRAPATIRTSVILAVKMAKRCNSRWYGISMPFRMAPMRKRRRHCRQRFLKRTSLADDLREWVHDLNPIHFTARLKVL